MRRSLFVLRVMGLSLALSAASGWVQAQDNSASPISVTLADRVASYTSGPLGANAPTGNPNATSGFPPKQPFPANATGSNAPISSDGGFFPLDVWNASGGGTIATAQHHPVYISQPPSHWGNPAAFLTDLGQSDFIQAVDQYVGINGRNRYTLGAPLSVNDPSITAGVVLGPGYIFGLVHAAAAYLGASGPGHIYHLFVPQGVNVCFTASICYSPDNPASWAFCSLHTYAIFADSVGEVVFTVEPYQNVGGCNVPPATTPNGQVADSTNNALAHEVFETITDPLFSSWYSTNYALSYGLEIADICQTYSIVNNNLYRSNPNVILNGNIYNVQRVYSNQFHSCTNRGDGKGN